MLAPPVVINLRDHRDWRPARLPADVIYIGGAVGRGGWRLAGSAWANPYRPKAGDRGAMLALYAARLRARLAAGEVRPDDILGLGGHRLACWCAPLPCHGDVLAAVWRELRR